MIVTSAKRRGWAGNLQASWPHKTAPCTGGTLRSVALRTYSAFHKKRLKVLVMCESPELSVPLYSSYCPCPQAREFLHRVQVRSGVDEDRVRWSSRALSSCPLLCRRTKSDREKCMLLQSWQGIYGDGLFQEKKKKCVGWGEPVRTQAGEWSCCPLSLAVF